MQIEKSDLENIIKETVKSTILELGIDKVEPKQERSAYQKTEILLYNYRAFQSVIQEKMKQIEELKAYGVPHKGAAIHTYAGNSGGTISGLSTEEEEIESAVYNIKQSINEVQSALDKINDAMKFLKSDPYYKILEMKYFDGMGQEDIAKCLKCSHQNVSYHKGRLIKALSLRLFPNDVVKEIMR